MKILIGICIGIVLAGTFPEQTAQVGAWATQSIHDLATTVADTTEPSIQERVIEPLSNWRTQ